MTVILTPPPQFAASSAEARPLYVLRPEDLAGWHSDRDTATQAWLDALGFEARYGTHCLLPGPQGLAGAVAGLGTAQARARLRFGLARVARELPAGAWQLHGDLTPAEGDEAALGWLLSQYRFDRYRPTSTRPAQAELVAPEGADRARLLAMAEGEFLTRDLINTPASDLGPEDLEEAFTALATRFGARVRVTRGDDLLSANFPLVHAVGRASARAPRIMDLTWGNSGPRVTLVGKGVCFDTGGLNIKSTAGMHLMKKDMGGAATVMGLALMIMQLALPVQLRVIVPAVENAISGLAQRPRDIVTSRKGLTVEINDTDAEGRLILADALAWADEEPADLIVSMATLTGSARVAVGPDLAPYYTDEADLAAALEAGAVAGFDPVWRLPLWPGYESMIEPGIADLDNCPPGSFAGSATAALFLRRFVANPRYMHFDIYGHCPTDLPARPKGGAGQGARALLAALPAMLGLT